MRATTTFQALCLGATLGLTGCISVHHDHEADRYERYGDYDYGPPPHAPAHGYRHHHYGADHIYDVHLGVYTVVGHPDIWFRDGFYYRQRGGYWERCNRLRGGHWGRADWAYVPERLRGRGPRHGDWDHRDRKEERWADRQERKEDRHERVDDRRREHDERVEQRHDERDERRVERHDRKDDKREVRDERQDWRQDERAERKVERHERVDSRHEQRDERAEQRRDERAERKAERHERKDDKREDRERDGLAGPLE